MSPDLDPSLPTRLGRALWRRCPRCGTPAFESYFGLRENCSGCGLHFEREEGYWVGALIINTAVAFGTFLVLFVGGIVLTWPDVPWTVLGVVTLVAMAIVPLLFYPLSKTIWMAIEMTWNKPT